MIKKIKNILINSFIAILVFITHIILVNILPNPWNNLNIFLLVSIWIIINREYFHFIKYLFIISLVSELFQSTPFGIITISLILTVIIFDWFLLNILTNRFFLMVWLAGFLSTLTYQLIFLLLIIIKNFFIESIFIFNSGFYWQVVWSCFINSSILTIFYLIFTFYYKKFNPKYLTEHNYEFRKNI